MRIHTTEEIKNILYKVQPMLARTQQVWRPDTGYAEVDPQLIKKVASLIDPKLKRVHSEKWDCDNIAVNLMNEVKKYCFLNNIGPDDKETAVAFALGFKWGRVQENHTANVFIFDGKAYAYDAQLDDFWPLTSVGDLLYFSYM